MRKTRNIAIILVIFIILLGVGYAAWTDTLTITTTAKTGTLDVNFEELPSGILLDPVPKVEANYRDFNERPLRSIKKGYVFANLTRYDVNGNNMAISIENMFPGSLVILTAKMANRGSIPVILDDVDVDSTNTELDNQMMCAGGFMVIRKEYNDVVEFAQRAIFEALNSNTISHLLIDAATDSELYYNGDGGAFWNIPLKDLDATLDMLLSEVKLNPGDYILFDIPEAFKEMAAEHVEAYDPETQNCLMFYLPMDSADNDSQSITNVSFDIDITWKQYNK